MTTRAPTSFVGQQPNPFVNPGPWGKVYIGGVLVPGAVQDVDGAEKPEQWDFQKATEKNNATSVWKGSELAKSIKIKTKIKDAAEFAALYTLRDTLRPKQGKKPPALSIVNPTINFNGIMRVSEVNIGQPKPQRDLSWDIVIEVCEFNPSKPANTGVASAANGAIASSGLGSYVNLASSVGSALGNALGAAKAAA